MSVRITGVVLMAMGGAALALSCADTGFTNSQQDGGDTGVHDIHVPPIGDGPPLSDLGSGACPKVPCKAGYTCYKGACIKSQPKCAKDDDCINDSFCDKGSCVPYGPKTKTFDKSCKGGGFKAEKFVPPTTRCSWTKSAVIMAPVVADLDGDKKPEIIFISFSTPSGNLIAIRGDTCVEVFNIGAGLGTRSQLAVADLNGDKVPEIIGITQARQVKVFSNKGILLATSTTSAKVTGGSYYDGAPAVANLDGKGPPEIVYAGMALRYQSNSLTTLYNSEAQGGRWGVLSVIADVDLDGTPDVVIGNKIIDGLTGADKTPPAVKGWKGGYVAIAQFDKTTKEPEIVLVSSQSNLSGTIRVYHPKTGKVVFGPYSFGQKFGGPPTVADFDGDGQPEVGAAGYIGYVVFDPECAKTPLPAQCSGPGMRWVKTTQDKSSGSTGSSVFDFNGDGAAEVVYRDECWLRVYDGKTGTVRFASSITSGTILELPVIADVNNDGHADLVVPGHKVGVGYCKAEPDTGQQPGPGTNGIYVLQDPKNRWMPSRGIWNQHTYHISNINDDATVPLKEANNWLSWNNYRQNTQGMIKGDAPAPDLTGKQQPSIEPGTDCVTKWVLAANICNRGFNKSQIGVPGTFYKGDPAKGGTLICTAKTTKLLSPGKCEAVRCNYGNPPKGTVDLWFVADDDGTGNGKEMECKEKNNRLHLPGAKCTKVK